MTLTLLLLSLDYTLDCICHAQQEFAGLVWTVCAGNTLMTQPRLNFLV